MKVKFIFIINVFFMLDIFSLSVLIPESTKQGDFITIYLTGAKRITNAEAKLIDLKGRVRSRISAFPVDDADKKQIILIGIPTWLETGNWIVEVSAMEGNTYHKESKTVNISKTTFKEYTLNLDSKNTELVTKPDPKKKEEAQTLTEILNFVNLNACRFSKNFIVPTSSKRITSTFGEKRKLIFNTGKTTTEVHYGVDFGIPIGSKISAPADGTIVFAGKRIVSGVTLIIEHAPGVYTLFYHLNRTLKEVGEKVTQGELVALSGNTGFSTGPHLHWEMRINTIPISPYSVVEKPLYNEW